MIPNAQRFRKAIYESESDPGALGCGVWCFRRHDAVERAVHRSALFAGERAFKSMDDALLVWSQDAGVGLND